MVQELQKQKKEEVPASALSETKEEQIENAPYSDEELTYVKKLATRLNKAKNLKDESREEFDYDSLVTYFNQNEKYANTILQNKNNKGETTFQSGTLRTKMMSFLNSFIASNFKGELTPFGQNNLPLQTIGNSFEDIIDKIDEMDNDEEKKMLRQYEMLKQGSVFVEDVFEDTTDISKTITSGVLGQVKGVVIETKKAPGCGRFVRRIISPLGIYLGSWRHYFIEDQPFLYTAEIWDRADAEKVYGTWERWKYVSKTKKSFVGSTEDLMINNAWRLTGELKENQVERIVYQDKPNREMNVVLNGVVMLPIGYPLTEISPDGEYTLVQQNLEPIRHDFSIGKSFIFKNKNISAILDEMMKLAVLKTQKSFLPPYLNLSGRIINSRIFMPAQITRGILPNEIVPVSEKEVQGVTNAEFQMIQEVMRFNDANTVSQTFTGAQEQGGGKVTATQISELQRQARLMMGLFELAATLLEKKLIYRRLVMLLRHWFNPVDDKVDEARNALVSKYRAPTVQMGYIEGRGQGARITVLSEEMPSSDQIKYEEDRLEKEYGHPIKIIVLNPKAIKDAKITWQINVTSKPKKTSELEKIMFGEEIMSAKNIGLMPNPSWLESKFAEKWGEDPNKMFSKEGQGMPQGMPGATPQGTPNAQNGAPTGTSQPSRIKPSISLNPQ